VSRGLIAGAILAAGLIAGGTLIQSGELRHAEASTGSSRLLDQVVARIVNQYVDSVSLDDLNHKAAFGLVKELDDAYSALLTADRAAQVRENATGRYPGVGVELDLRDGFVTVIAPLPGTPADSAGVRPGDRIVTVDDKPTFGLTMDEVQRLMRGPAGSRVTLGIERGDVDVAPVTLTRRVIEFHPVQDARLLKPGVAYVELATFSQEAARELRRAIDALRGQGARALILDLRGNPGGLLEQGVEVADLFLDAGQGIVSTRGRTADADQQFSDGAAQPWAGMPIVALVDSGSASAAEIVAGALQDNERAVLVGSPTYGKGSAQSLFPLREGHALKLTTARWFTPKGRTIERDSTTGGIAPDLVVRPAEGAASPAPRPAAPSPLTADPVVARALQLLEGVTSPAQLRSRITATRGDR
jgi:carboxyl-terminal processing protease